MSWSAKSRRVGALHRLDFLGGALSRDDEESEEVVSPVTKRFSLEIVSRSIVQKKKLERVVLAELPILIESLILMVESGLGILPAIYKLLETQEEETKLKSTRYYLRLVHELSQRGFPFGQALEQVAEDCPFAPLRHFFLYLDIGANVGGKLGNSLRSLAQHAHQEWKLSVEARVRRLENLVVFPVFGSVIGLVLLTASVPLIPLLELRDKLDAVEVQKTDLKIEKDNSVFRGD